MKPRLTSFVLVSLLMSAWLPRDSADAQEKLATCGSESVRVCSLSSGDTIMLDAVADADGAGGQTPEEVARVARSAPPSPFRNESRLVPTCLGNAVDGEDALCAASGQACPEPGQIRFWVYRRTVDTRIPGDDPPFVRDVTPPFVCSSSGAPEVDPKVALATLVDRDFQRIVVVKGVPVVSPRPDTLVNIDTIFTTSTTPSYAIPVTLLGKSVVVTATAARWTWHFGDGTTESTDAPGSQGRVTHTYERSGTRSAYVVIEWTGTFRVDGGSVQQVNGTATTTGDPVTVEVKQARTELVDQPT